MKLRHPGTAVLALVLSSFYEPAAASPDTVTAVDWLSKPTGDDVARTFPDKAQRASVQGMGLIECFVTADGRLADCQVQSESPKGYGFGAAALQLASRFRMSPMDKKGQATAGRLVRIPIQYRLPNDSRPAPPVTSRPGSPAFILSFGPKGDTPCATVTHPERTCVRHAMTFDDEPKAPDVRAAERNVAASTSTSILACSISASRTLVNCAAPPDTPPDAKAAMLSLTPQYRAPPAARDGEPTAGKTVIMLFDWPAIRTDAETTRVDR